MRAAQPLRTSFYEETQEAPMLFRKNVVKKCAYCAHAGQANDGKLLCPKRGFVSADGSCRRFRYDPLKRTPKKQKAKDFTAFTEEDFRL